MEDPEVQRLAELVRQGERVLDHQIRNAEEQDDKAEQMISLGTAVLAGGFTLAAWLADKVAPTGAGYLAAMGAGLCMNLAALALFLNGYGTWSAHVDLETGPAPAWLAEQAERKDLSLADHQRMVLAGLTEYYRGNTAVALFASRQRQRGARWLAASVVTYGLVIAAYLYAWSRL